MSGSRPGLQQGIAPTVVAFVGYLFALVAAVLLIVPAAEGHGGTRTLGRRDPGGGGGPRAPGSPRRRTGPNIGAGFVQLIGEVVILVAAVRLALGVAAARAAPGDRARPAARLRRPVAAARGRVRLPRVRRPGGARPPARDLDRRPDDARLRAGAPAGPARSGRNWSGTASRALTDGPAARRRARRLARRARTTTRRPPTCTPSSMLAGSTADGRGRRRAAPELLARRSTSGRTGSGTTTPGWRSRSGTGRGRRLDDYRGLNANMHGVEASLARPPTRSDRSRRSPTGCAPRRCAAPSASSTAGPGSGDWRLPEHFTAAGQPLPDYNRDSPADPFRPFGVTVGHQFEWARLALHLRSVLGRPAGLAARRRPSRCSTPPRPAAGRPTGTTASRTRSAGTTARSSRPACTGCSARRSPRRPCSAAVTGEQRYRDLAARWRGARRAAVRRSGDRQLAPRAHAGRRGRHRHLVGSARRVPPGPDAAARRPPGARQRHRRAALIVGRTTPRRPTVRRCPHCCRSPNPASSHSPPSGAPARPSRPRSGWDVTAGRSSS